MKTLILAYLIVPLTALAGPDRISIEVGQALKLKGNSKLWVENGKIAKAKQIPGGISLVGISPGRTLYRWNDLVTELSVKGPNSIKAKSKLATIINHTLGLTLHGSNEKTIINGKLLRWSDWKKLSDTCFGESCDYVMQAEVSDPLKDELQRNIKRELRLHGLSPQKMVWNLYPKVVIPSSDPQKELLKTFFSSYGIVVIEDKNRIRSHPLIRIKVTVAEIRKSEAMNLGINWGKSIKTQVLPRYNGEGATLDAQLNFLESKGLAKNLATPNILCHSGKEAEFFAGGEIPIKIIKGLVNNVIWKPYGIILKFSPTADYQGRMNLGIQTEVSELEEANKADNIPGLKINRIKSFLSLEKSQTVVLSGLLTEKHSDSTEGVALLSRLPVIGSLFSSSEFKNDKSELFVFVRPEVIEQDDLDLETSQEENNMKASRG